MSVAIGERVKSCYVPAKKGAFQSERRHLLEEGKSACVQFPIPLSTQLHKRHSKGLIRVFSATFSYPLEVRRKQSDRRVARICFRTIMFIY